VVNSSPNDCSGYNEPDRNFRFDNIYGEGGFARLRSMLDDPSLAYQHIANTFGLTRQRIAQLAAELGINGKATNAR
jgi:hypothetical protein